MSTVYALLSVILVSLVSLVGVMTLSLNDKRLRRILFILVALSVGALFGDVFIHILPEVFAEAANPLVPSVLILGGILIFFALEKFLRWDHHHDVDECEHGHIHPSGPLNLVSDALHNLIDGIIIGVSFLAGPSVGIATTIAVILHEIPQEIGDFAILINAGYSRQKALALNLLSALFAILGVILALVIGEQSQILATIALPLAAGGFIYIAGSDLVPELHKIIDLRKSLLQFAAILLGIGLMAVLVFFE